MVSGWCLVLRLVPPPGTPVLPCTGSVIDRRSGIVSGGVIAIEGESIVGEGEAGFVPAAVTAAYDLG